MKTKNDLIKKAIELIKKIDKFILDLLFPELDEDERIDDSNPFV